MGITVKKNTAYAVMEESVEGVYEAPSSASKFVQTLTDGAELSPSKEVIERNIFTSSIGKTSPRTGQFQVSGAMPVECRANSVEGAAPEYDSLLKSALGLKRQISSTITSKASGNTASQMQIEDADIDDLNVGDIILVKMPGAFHVSPILSKVTTPGSASVTLLIPHPSGDIADSAVIAKSTVYTVADAGHPSLSISKYLDGAVLEKAVGARVNSMSLENFSTGQLPSLNFGYEGLNFDRTLTTIPYTPAYDSALPPIVLDARAYMDTTALEINDISLSLENTLGFQSSISEVNGRKSGRATERTISGTFNPYKLDNSISNFTKYKNDTPFKLFAYAKVPTGVAGEFGNIVAVYMPNCVITEIGESDQDGLLQENISFSANRGASGTTNEIYIAFI